jgi:hypothetical protein
MALQSETSLTTAPPVNGGAVCFAAIRRMHAGIRLFVFGFLLGARGCSWEPCRSRRVSDSPAL